jgi:hypothetical protein
MKNLKGKELFKYLVENKSDLIELKKSATKFSESVSMPVVLKEVGKSATTIDLKATEIEKTIIGNTYGWLDTHDDVHIEGIFTKSIAENQTRILHLHDHIQQLTAKVGKPLKIYEDQIKWKDLGVDKTGSTTALFMDSKIMKSYNEIIFEGYLNKEIDQHSVGMQYTKLFMCINDDEYKEEYANWNKYIGFVGNADKAEDQGYFFAVTEAKVKEISCVIAGSNELTPTLDSKADTSIEPVKSTQEKPSIDFTQLKTIFN